MSHKMETPWDIKLHTAAETGDLYNLQQILDSGRVHVDCADENGITPLMKVAGKGFYDACILLIDEGAAVNAVKPDGATSLMFASQYGQLEVVELLLKEGAKSNLRTKEGGSALLSAAQNGKSQCCKLLLSTTPSSSPSSSSSDANECLNDGANGIFLSAQNNHLQTLKVLKEYGCSSGKERNDGTTPLWIAAQLGHDAIVQELLSFGEEDSEKSNNGATALFKASQKGHERVVKLLLENKPNLGLLKNGETCLHGAALFGNLSIAKMLIDAGSDPRLPNRFGETPLDLAFQMNYEDIVEFLKKAKSVHK